MPSVDVAALLRERLAGDDPARRLLGGIGWALPDLAKLPLRDLGNGNLVASPQDRPILDINVPPGARDNLIIVEGVKSGPFKIKLDGEANTVIVRESRKLRATLVIGGTGNLFYSGLGTTANEANFVVGIGGAGTSLLLGEDCMLSQRVQIRATDSHGMIDLRSGEVLNRPESVIVHPHVWIGFDVTILKGVEVGAGGIIGANSLVTRSLPPVSASAGSPATPRREATSWTRRPDPGEAERRNLTKLLRDFGVHPEG